MARRELLAKLAEARLAYMDAWLSDDFDVNEAIRLQNEIQRLQLLIKQFPPED